MKKRAPSPTFLILITILAAMQTGTAHGQDTLPPDTPPAQRLDVVAQMGGLVTDSVPLADGSMLAAEGSALIRVSGGFGTPGVTARADLAHGAILDLAKATPSTAASPWILALTESGMLVLPEGGEGSPTPTSFTPGGGQAMAVIGDLVAVAAQDAGLRVLRLGADGTLTPLSEIRFTAPGGAPAQAVDVTLAADARRAYVATGPAGVQVVDLSDPSAPLPTGSLPEPYPAEAITMAGALLAVGSEGRVLLIDPTPGAGRVGLYAPIREARRVVIQDEYAYIADAVDGVKILWLAAPDRPVLVYGEAGRPAMDLALVGDMLFVAGAEGLRILDVSSRYRPLEIGSALLPDAAEGLALDTGAEGMPERVFLASGEGGAAILDVRNLSSPQITGRVQLEGTARSILFDAGTVYVAMDEAGLAVIDAREPDRETLIAAIALPGRALDLERRGNALYIAAGDAGVLALDVTRAHTPVLAGILPLEPIRSDEAAIREARSISISGKRAYVAEGNSIMVVDVSYPNRLGRLERIDTPAEHATTNGIYLYTVGSEAVNVYDARATAEPIFMRTYRGMAQIAHLAAQDSILFATSAGPGPDVVTISLLAPDAPVELDSVGSSGGTYRISPAGGDVWLAAGFGGLRRYSVTEGGALISRGRYMPIAEAGSLSSDGATLIAGGRHGWSALTLGDNLRASAGDTEWSNITGAAVFGEAAVVLNESGLALYDLSVEDTPALIATHEVQGTALAIDERYVYVAEVRGLAILDRQYLMPFAQIATPAPPVALTLRGSLVYLALTDGRIALVEVGDPTGGIVIRRSLTTRRPTRLIAGPEGQVYGLADDLLARLFISDVQRLGVIEDGTLPLITPQGFFADDGIFAAFVPGETLRFYDVRQLNDGPVWHSAIDMSGDITPAEAVAVKGRIVYAAYGDRGLGIIDRTATSARAIFHDDPAYALLLAGDRLFAAGRSISVWNVATPQAPVLIASQPLTAPARHIDLAPDGQVLVSTESGIAILGWDSSSLAAVGHLASPAVDRAAQIGGRLYAALHQGGLLVADVSDPAAPETLFTFLSPTGQFITDLFPLNERELLVSWEGGIDALDVTSTAPAPHLIGVFESNGERALDLALSGDGSRAVVALGEEGASVIDLSDPVNPRLIGHIDTPGEARRAALDGTVLVVADGVCGVRVFDATDPTSMQETAVWRGGYAGSVAMADGGIYIGAGNQLYALRYDPSAPPTPPPAPQQPFPLDGSGAVDLHVVLGWEPAANRCDPLTYDVFFGAADNPAFVGQVTGDPVLDVGDLDPLRTYHWRVESVDAQGNRTRGPDWSFTTVRGEFLETLPPAPPVFIDQVREHPAIPIGITAIFLLAGVGTAIYWRTQRYPTLEQDVPSWYSADNDEPDSA